MQHDAYLSLLSTARGLESHGNGLFTAHGAETAFSPESHHALRGLEEGSWWFAHRNRCIAELVRRHRPDGVIVDVGAGNGWVTSGLRTAGFEALVLEPGAEGAQNALARGLSPVVNATLESAGFPQRSLAAVGMFDVLEHLPDDAGALRDVAALLAPRGWLYLTVPAWQWLWSDEDVTAGHQRRYGRGELTARLTAAGFRVAFESYFFTPLPAPIFALRSVPSALGLGARSDARRAAEHGGGATVVKDVALAALAFEVAAISRGISLPFGASQLVAAQMQP
jgi:SAM-dependent methyltransferase